MKKIGIMYGMEQTFPPAVIDNINERNISGISAEFIQTGAVKMDDSPEYNVIFDRVSHEVPFYRAILKGIALNGARVVNNPFWNCADDNFFHSTLATKIGINVPKTVILPSKEHPAGTSSETMRNLIYPLNWDDVFDYIGFPAYIKPNRENGFYNHYKVYNPQEFFAAYDLTGSKAMVLQEDLQYEAYCRAFVIGKKEVKLMDYNPTQPYHLRYTEEEPSLSEKNRKELEKIGIKICTALGFDFNSIEFAIVGGKPYAIDFLNQFPNAERAILHDSNFEWLVNATADYLVELARLGRYRSTSYNWSAFLRGPKSPAKKRRTSKLNKNS